MSTSCCLGSRFWYLAWWWSHGCPKNLLFNCCSLVQVYFYVKEVPALLRCYRPRASLNRHCLQDVTKWHFPISGWRLQKHRVILTLAQVRGLPSTLSYFWDTFAYSRETSDFIQHTSAITSLLGLVHMALALMCSVWFLCAECHSKSAWSNRKKQKDRALINALVHWNFGDAYNT